MTSKVPLSNLQLEFLKLYADNVAEEDLKNIQRMIARYFAEKAIAQVDEIWDEKGYSAEQLLSEYQKLPIGIQSFREIRENQFLYVDKTETIFQLITEGKYYFLSRPRRFGKSLTLSTIKEIFQGGKELFDGLWIQDQWDWTKQHPVVHISFSSIGYKELGLEKAIENRLKEIAKKANIILKNKVLSQIFKELIEKLSINNNVVILIDEYDKPIIDYLDDLPKAKEHQKTLKNFYSIVKDSDPYIRFLLITGVSKISRASVFSELNHLDDITIDWRFAALVGLTQEEVEDNFEAYLQTSQKELNINREELLRDLKKWYNGYSWDGEIFVYNPFSILSFFQKSAFRGYWFFKGPPLFLTNVLKGTNLYQLGRTEIGQTTFDSFDVENIEIHSFLFHEGYLAIKRKEPFGLFILGYPNREVENSMLQYLAMG